MAAIRLRGLRKEYPGGQVAVANLDLEIADGELFVLVGPSGCGKSTVLRLLAGLEPPASGSICLDEQDVTRLPPQERDVAMVFQDYALYPHKTVRENLAFGLRMRKVERTQIEARVAEVAEMLDIAPLLGRKPRQLSGGQRQRVALGRAIARQARAYLLDEPLSNLDAKLRVHTRTELGRLQQRLGATMVYVTHDQEEAMTLGNRVAVMREGRLEQVGPPLEVYQRPASRFVASFVGSPEMNFLPGQVGPDGVVACGPLSLRFVGLPPQTRPGDRVVLGVRPQDILLGEGGEVDVRARVEVVEPLGPSLLCHLDLDGQSLRILVPTEHAVVEGADLSLRLRRDRLHLFHPEGPRLPATAA